MPGADIADAVREGYAVNLPLRTVRGGGTVAPLVAVDHAGVVVEAVKLAEDRSGDVVVRLYEALGGRAQTGVRVSVPVTRVVETDLLERPTGDVRAEDMAFRPFQIRTLRFSLAAHKA